MIRKRHRGLYEKKGKHFALFLALACIFFSIFCGAMCASAGEEIPAEDNNSMDVNKIIEETKSAETSPFLLEIKDVVPDAPVSSESCPTESIEESTPTEDAGSSEPKETQGEVVIALAADGASRYPGLILTQEDLDLLINIIWLEARGEPFEGMQGVVEVTFNRVVHKKYFPNSIRDVIYDEDIAIQYPTVHMLSMADPTEGQRKVYTDAIKKALNGPYVLPIEVVFFGVYPENDNIWGAIGNHHFCYPWYPEP